MTLNRVAIPSPNYSGRAGGTVRLIVCHTAEGALTYQSLGSYFGNSASGVSSHVGIDDTPNTVGEYVRRDYKAWTAAAFNPIAVQAELCAFSAWSSSEWDRHPTMLTNLSQWMKEEAQAFNIPLVRLTPAQAQGNGRGVCEHKDLGRAGGGHVDCGPYFPIDRCIQNANYNTNQPSTPPILTPEEPDVKAAPCTFTMDSQQQAFMVAGNGQMLHWYQVIGKPWVKEALSMGWDADTDVNADVANGTYQVWARKADGRGGQIYWNGRQWVTQDLP